MFFRSTMGSSMMELSSVFPVRKAEIGLLLKAQPFLGFSSRATRVCVRAAKGESGPKKSSSSFNKPVTRRKRSPWNDVVEEPNGTNGRKPTNKSSRRRSSSPRRSSRKSRLESTSEGFPTLAADNPRVLVSAVMPVAIEKILQAGEPAATPSWQTFTSSLCGVWRGVGAAFSPSTAEMEAIALGNQDEMLYDSRILSTVEECKGTDMSEIHRKTVWAVGNPYGEQGKGKFQVQDLFPLPEDFTDDGKNGDTLRGKNNGDLDFELIKDSMGGNGNLLTIEELKLRIKNNGDIDFKLIEDVDRSEDGNLFTIEDSGIQSEDESSRAKTSDLESPNLIYDSGIQSEDETSQAKTSDLESPNLIYDAVMEEDVLELEPGLVFFEDGSYSRGPVTVLDGDLSNESSVFKIEQVGAYLGHFIHFQCVILQFCLMVQSWFL
ncbi:hypothetical protein KP509_33G028700 [Ceratopteris richardii]|uniref:Uncharacterized protein n=1 Tax=Ceratopteris richardii TaxID=49495 RepID=A0A8T2QMQ8_CERRI|nr:hypothetical protein KP509_33G028700 [Ceratopteris richardii]